MTRPDEDALVAACNMVRSAGYQVVSNRERDRWQSLLDQAHAETRRAEDVNQRLWWWLDIVSQEAKKLVGDSRPRWYRDFRRFVNSHEMWKPLVWGERGETEA